MEKDVLHLLLEARESVHCALEQSNLSLLASALSAIDKAIQIVNCNAAASRGDRTMLASFEAPIGEAKRLAEQGDAIAAVQALLDGPSGCPRLAVHKVDRTASRQHAS
jgi:hypothetical protein